MAGTPDRCASCSCCGLRLVDIKCLYSLRNSTVAEAMKNDGKFYLNKDGQLKKLTVFTTSRCSSNGCVPGTQQHLSKVTPG